MYTARRVLVGTRHYVYCKEGVSIDQALLCILRGGC